jgi:uncharacterized repeat protein (TIGR03803 family)
MRSKRFCSAAKSTFVIFITLLLALGVVPTQAQAQKFKVLHTFHGKDGAAPVGQLVRDKAGNLYGTAVIGGLDKCQGGCGTAFKMDKTGKMVWVHSFNGANGRQPEAGLLRDVAGNLFGTTIDGGKIDNQICPDGERCGVVFRLNESGEETVLHKFTGPPDGYFPESLLVEDSAGNLYGTTYIGGTYGAGTVFKFDAAGKETILYNFTGGSDGCSPDPGVILDSAGNLYGVAGGGASGCTGYGVVFEVDTSGSETVLHTFGGGDGASPDSVLLFDSQGNLYGTTALGGSSDVCDYEGGCGTVFELSPQNGSWLETVLYNFCSLSDCTDGQEPLRGPLVRDAAGNLYGTTYFGGNVNLCNGSCGVVFKLDAAGNETVLHSFTGGKDGALPWGGLTAGPAGSLYGAAQLGGNVECESGSGIPGCGTVFKITA